MRRPAWLDGCLDLARGPGGVAALTELLRIRMRESRVPGYVLPDPLVFASGEPVRSPEAWRARRAELLDLFRREVYGPAPAGPALVARVESEGEALGGRAIRRELRLAAADDPARPALHLLVLRPAEAAGPVPAFLALNFRGNHTVHPDPGIRLADAWVPADPGGGVVDGRASEAARGARAPRWPVETILSRGYALATAYAGDLAPDHPDLWRAGLVGPDVPAAGGALAVWAWGLSRLLDACVEEPGLDPARIAVLGHSRLGKAALWAAAQDERFALVVANETGCMGAALTRRRFGETPAFLARAFPHWMAPRFREQARRAHALPVDQHALLALVAPRPLYVASAAGDRWSDPRGEELAARAVGPVYRLLGARGLADDAPVDPDAPLPDGAVGYHRRPGGHGITARDWARFLDFADRWLGAPAARTDPSRPPHPRAPGPEPPARPGR